MVQHEYEVRVVRKDRPRPVTHCLPADNAAHAKRKMREQYEQEGVAFQKMTAKKFW